MSRRRTHRDGRAWPKRRQWLDRIASETRLTHGCKSWLLQLAKRSDDLGKPVWGNQVKMAAELGRCDRSVRRYRAEAEQLGYVLVFRSKPQRAVDGRFCRRKSNSYYLCLPAKAKAADPAPRRRQRAPYCVVRRHRSAASLEPVRAGDMAAHAAQGPVLTGPAAETRMADCLDLADSDDRSTPLNGVRQPSPPPTASNTQDPHYPSPLGIAAARAALAACNPPSPTPKHHTKQS